MWWQHFMYAALWVLEFEAWCFQQLPSGNEHINLMASSGITLLSWVQECLFSHPLFNVQARKVVWCSKKGFAVAVATCHPPFVWFMMCLFAALVHDVSTAFCFFISKESRSSMHLPVSKYSSFMPNPYKISLTSYKCEVKQYIIAHQWKNALSRLQILFSCIDNCSS